MIKKLISALAVPALLVVGAAPAAAAFRTYRTGSTYRHVTWEYDARVANSAGAVRISVQSRSRVTALLAGADWRVTLQGRDGAGRVRCHTSDGDTNVRQAYQNEVVLWCPGAARVRRAVAYIDVARDGKARAAVPLVVTCDRSWFAGSCARWGYPR